ncbi:MAG: alpha,alpha-trehalase TreF [Ignavibacteriaceae bacterium]
MIKKKFLLILIFQFLICFSSYPQVYETYKNLKSKYIQLSGNLFKDVQLSGIFSDSKTFVDAVPKRNPARIKALYDSVKGLPDFDLRQFVYANFIIPNNTDTIKAPENKSMNDHIEDLWEYLIRTPHAVNVNSTLLPLKFPYIVPGGRFREIYYWDSFFTILGLLADGKVSTAENMVYNFAYMLDKYKMIPNGNRIYYLTRSQPPFFSLMVDVICKYKNDYSWGLQFLNNIEEEYSFWMNGLNHINNTEKSSERVVMLNRGEVLNRYYDFDDVPREESYKADYENSNKINKNKKPEFFRNVRSAAESGWDFSSRWFKDQKSLTEINTTDILPVDLNCLLYFLENRLAFFYGLKGELGKSNYYQEKALKRRNLINKIFWNKKEGFYFDYNWRKGAQTNVISLAGCFPLYFGIAKPEYAKEAAEKMKSLLLKPGGLVTTLNETGQQWDAPNGWPPLQWIAIKGLREYSLNSLAGIIKERWLTLNKNVYKRTGKMLEKYNVEDTTLFGGGGEYPLQDGFGWTNGVAAALINNYDQKFLINK